MRVLGFEIKRATQTVGSRGWFPWVREPYTGAWQKNDEWSAETVLAYHAVYACVTLIANDIGKLRQKLVQLQPGGIWKETTSPSFSPVLRRPNRYQNHIQFKQWWMTSKLLTGNTYGLKARDQSGRVKAIYLLDPRRVQVQVSPDGSIFYELSADNLSSLQESVMVPASEIIHDRMNCLFHPLVGVSPIFACGSAANIGLKIEGNSSNFFANGSNPGGILMVPGSIPDTKAKELKASWDENYAGDKVGKVAVLGDGMKFQALRMSAVDSQLIEQLRWTAEVVCSTFHVPPYMIGVGQMPTYNNVEALGQQYYSQCLQSLIEEYEACMDDGLGIETPTNDAKQFGVELDLKGLLRMDTATQVKTATDGINGGLHTTNEARADFDLPPVKGGDVIWRQRQYYSLEALDERDKADPFATPEPAPAAPDDEPANEEEMDEALDA